MRLVPQFCDACETFVVQMKEILFIHFVFQRRWIPRVWTVIAIVLRKCYRVDVWARGVEVGVFSVPFGVRVGLVACLQSMLGGV